MDRIYRVEQGGQVFHAVDRDGVLRRVTGHVFGDWAPGAPVEGGLSAVDV